MRIRLLSVPVMMALIVVVTLGGVRTAVAGPQAAQAPDPLTALLAEVHALRIAMERSATVAPRVQLTLARLNIEEQRIAQLAAQLDQVRRELSAASLDAQKLSDQVPEMERGLQAATDDKTRKSYEYEQADLKRKLGVNARLEAELRTRENEAAQALSTEQSRWIDLNARLDELERLLGPAPR
jgi:predicted  nucleic acid-binding Zn-ribbon protein